MTDTLHLLWHRIGEWARRRRFAATTRRRRLRWAEAAPKVYPAVLVPDGPSCRAKGGRVCPFWHAFDELPREDSGYCSLTGRADYESGLGLLRAKVKTCGINED